MSALFGWDLTFKTVEKDITQKSDVAVAFLHWNLIKRGFQCIGTGDEHTLTGNEERTELLPSGWNYNNERYSLRYLLDDKLYILLVISNNGHLLSNLMRSQDLSVTNVTFNLDELVKSTSGPIETLIPDYKDVIANLKDNLIDSLISRPTATTATQTNTDNLQQRSLLERRPRCADNVYREDDPTRPNLWAPPEADPFNIGRQDLDPFGRGGGGMLFNPFGPSRGPENPGLGIPGGLPRGAVPPGARFDPFGPPGVGPMPPRRQPPPDSDHLPPPGFGDMFM